MLIIIYLLSVARSLKHEGFHAAKNLAVQPMILREDQMLDAADENTKIAQAISSIVQAQEAYEKATGDLRLCDEARALAQGLHAIKTLKTYNAEYEQHGKSMLDVLASVGKEIAAQPEASEFKCSGTQGEQVKTPPQDKLLSTERNHYLAALGETFEVPLLTIIAVSQGVQVESSGDWQRALKVVEDEDEWMKQLALRTLIETVSKRRCEGINTLSTSPAGQRRIQACATLRTVTELTMAWQSFKRKSSFLIHTIFFSYSLCICCVSNIDVCI